MKTTNLSSLFLSILIMLNSGLFGNNQKNRDLNFGHKPSSFTNEFSFGKQISTFTINPILNQFNPLVQGEYLINQPSTGFNTTISLAFIPMTNTYLNLNQNIQDMKSNNSKNENIMKNRRLIYSSVWAFASLNYLYCDLAAFMDKNMHEKYHTGSVDGFEMSPGFIAASAGFMQIAMANVFLPHLIKNDRTLRWVQIASGIIMTSIQTATLFVDKPTSYYAVFSGFEIAATTFITIDAISWKTKPSKQLDESKL